MVNIIAKNGLISKERISRGWSTEKMGEMIGTTSQTVTRVERGESTSPGTAKKIAEALGLQVDDIFEISNEERIALTIGQNLKNLRKLRHLTQAEMAKYAELEISQASLAAYETGAREPNMKVLRNLARFFGVTVDSLLEKRDTSRREYLWKGNGITVKELVRSLESVDKDAKVWIAPNAHGTITEIELRGETGVEISAHPRPHPSVSEIIQNTEGKEE